jgi:hypothetical protein
MEGLYRDPFPSTKPVSIILRMILSTAAFEGAQTRILGLFLAAIANASFFALGVIYESSTAIFLTDSKYLLN